MKKGQMTPMNQIVDTFESRLGRMRLLRQNTVLIKWLLMAISVTLLLVYLLTPIRDIIFAS